MNRNNSWSICVGLKGHYVKKSKHVGAARDHVRVRQRRTWRSERLLPCQPGWERWWRGGDGDIYADGDHKIKKKGDVLGLCGYLPVYNLDQKFLHVHKFLLRSVWWSRQMEVLGRRLIGSEVSDGAILLEKHNLYESGLVCSLLFVYSLSAGERCWWTLCLDKSGDYTVSFCRVIFYLPPSLLPSLRLSQLLKLCWKVTAERFPRSNVAQ